VFHHNNRDSRVTEQLKKPLTIIVDAGADFFDNLTDLSAFGGAVVNQPVSLPLQIVLHFVRRDPGIDRHLLRQRGVILFSDDDGAGLHL